MSVIRYLPEESDSVVFDDNLLTSEQEAKAPIYATLRRVRSLRNYIENEHAIHLTGGSYAMCHLYDRLEEALQELNEEAMEGCSRLLGEYKMRDRKPPEELINDINEICEGSHLK